jgi:hypothetical protein
MRLHVFPCMCAFSVGEMLPANRETSKLASRKNHRAFLATDRCKEDGLFVIVEIGRIQVEGAVVICLHAQARSEHRENGLSSFVAFTGIAGMESSLLPTVGKNAP